LRYHSGLQKREGERGPDYIHISAGIYVATGAITVTKSGQVYIGGGFARGSLKSIISGKWGFSASAGMLICPKGRPATEAEVDSMVAGAAMGATAYLGVGGGYVRNSSGQAMELGLGTPGVSFQGFEYLEPVFNIRDAFNKIGGSSNK
jgi:hypothetical protein